MLEGMRSRTGAATTTATGGQYGELPGAGVGADSSDGSSSSVSLANAEQLGEIQEIHLARKIFHMLWVRNHAY